MNDSDSFKIVDDKIIDEKKDSFKVVDDDIDSKVDATLEKLKEQIETVEVIREVEEHPPEPGYMSVKLEPGEEIIDLHTLFKAELSDSPGTVIPMLVDHTVRTALDLKTAFRPEKRHLDFEYWWLIFLFIGIAASVFLLNMFFKIF